ncbi:hypothetical protein D3C75_552310 [compost metagenome]
MVGHGTFSRQHGAFRILLRFLLILFPAPAFWQIAVKRIVSAGLVGDQIRAHAARHQFRDDIRRVTAQGNRDRFAFRGVFLNSGQRVVQAVGLLIHVAGAQTEIDSALLAFNVQGAGAREGGRQRLRAAHPA